MAWIIEENKLDAQQRDFLDNVDINRKNVWIKGFAGSGKSILLAYTAKKGHSCISPWQYNHVIQRS